MIVLVGLVLGFVAAVVLGIFRDLVSAEIKGRLELLPHFILRLAAAQLNEAQFESIYKAEWLPELDYILQKAANLPVTRCIIGTKYSFGLLISARRIARQLNRELGASHAEQLFAAEGSQSSVLSVADPRYKELPRPFEIQSHQDLLQFPNIPLDSIHTPSGMRSAAFPVVDAIVVPTIRTADHLRPAVRFAAESRCHLIVVSTDEPPAGLAAVLSALRPGQVTLLTVRSDTKHPLLDLGTSLPQSLVAPSALDISRKRNLGLLIGRVCGWNRMLFLDDDIRKLNVAKLWSAAALLDGHPVVGLQVRKYPEASVVGHARRIAGRRQELFVSGGSLLVNPQLLNGYFVPVCHGDWLCLINHLRAREVAVGGSVSQLPYMPFAAPDRATREEFGDILLSGLLWLVHAHLRAGADQADDTAYWREATEPSFWKHILEQRAELLQEITKRHNKRSYTSSSSPSPLPSLEAAKRRLAELNPAEFVSFMEGWLTSLAEWRDQLSVLSQVDLVNKERAVEKALAELGLGQVVRRVRSRPGRKRGRSGAARIAARALMTPGKSS